MTPAQRPTEQRNAGDEFDQAYSCCGIRRSLRSSLCRDRGRQRRAPGRRPRPPTLAAIVAESSPLLGASDKALLAKFLNGQTNIAYPAGETTLVSVDKITCRASNVDITDHSCDLVFGKKTVKLMGRLAHELYATLA